MYTYIYIPQLPKIKLNNKPPVIFAKKRNCEYKVGSKLKYPTTTAVLFLRKTSTPLSRVPPKKNYSIN